MPNSQIQWIDPLERPITESIIGRTIAIKTDKGKKIIITVEPLCADGEWFTTVSWINRSNFKYIILPE